MCTCHSTPEVVQRVLLKLYLFISSQYVAVDKEEVAIYHTCCQREQSTADSPHKKLTVGERNSQRPPLSAKWKDRYHTVQKGAKVKADGKIKKLISFANDNSEQCSKTAQEQAEMDRKQSVKVRKDKAQVAR